MTLTSNQLTDSGMGPGLTTNFKVQYDDSLPNQANVIRNANALIAILENLFTVTTGANWFNTPAGKFGTGHRQEVDFDKASGSGAVNWGYGGRISMDSQNTNNDPTSSLDICEMIFINEWVEVLMDINGKWNRGNSMGEALSQYAGIILAQTGHYDYYLSWVDSWLNTHPRQNWVSTTEGTDGNVVSFGCGLAFIFYLTTQLSFTIAQVIAAGASTFAAIYNSLTGDPGDPYGFFEGLIENVYPSSATANIPGPVTDNPFPLAELSFWVDKDTFGLDEVKDWINTSGGDWKEAYWVVVEGFSKNSFNALGATVANPTGPFANLAGVTIAQKSAIDFENATLPQAPQRIRVPYDITLGPGSLGDFPSSGSQTYELDDSLTISGATVLGSSTSTQFELVAGEDPYFTNIDPNQNNLWYLSQDLRVFTATPAMKSVPVTGGPAFPSDSVAGAFSYVQKLLSWLNSTFSDPGGADPFATVLPGQAGALQGDSSVMPLTLDLSKFPSISLDNNYNFAVARVRLRSAAGTTAQNVRVFFRLWSTETADTDYQTGTTYPSTSDTAGLPASPLVGAGDGTIPFFATGNFSGNTDYASGGVNNIDIAVGAGKDVWTYFGCFLNLYDPSNLVDGQQVQHWLNGNHHCLVAQIAYDGTPVIPGATPESSDKLAQRNLQVTLSDNPGPPSTHRIPQTFDVRPSAAVVLAGGQSPTPDELMIDWGAVPSGSVASVYWPQVMASDVITLAAQIYGSHTLTAADTHTVQCKVTGGITYVPIPTGTGDGFAGLLTIDLPSTVLTGQEFNVVVRRVSTRQVPVIQFETLPSTVGRAARPVKGRAKVQQPPSALSWRYVVGTFQVKIPVSTGEVMLWPEENTLAIMKWRFQQMDPSSRWYPVLDRYIQYLAARVDGLGGDSTSVLPSPKGAPPSGVVTKQGREYVGKVSEVLFDCFGAFEGFVLRDCDEAHTFKTCERGIGEVVLRACKDQLTVAVLVEDAREGKIRRLAIRCC